MKILTFLLLVLSFSSFAHEGGGAAMGGQSGNGGNGCWVRNPGGSDEWTSLEEIEYWHAYAPAPFFTTNKEPTIVSRSKDDKPREYNLYKTYSFRRVERDLYRLRKKYPFLTARLLEWSKLFQRVYILNTAVKGHFGAELPKKSAICVEFSPAMAVLENGAILLYRTVWNSLDYQSQKIILVHEVIRLAQMFDPYFNKMSNALLQKFTAAITSGRLRLVRNEALLTEIEFNLSSKPEDKIIPFPDASYTEAILQKDSAAAFKIILKSAEHQDQSPMGDYVNAFRTKEVHFVQLVEKDLAQSLSAPRREKAR